MKEVHEHVFTLAQFPNRIAIQRDSSQLHICHTFWNYRSDPAVLDHHGEELADIAPEFGVDLAELGDRSPERWCDSFNLWCQGKVNYYVQGGASGCGLGLGWQWFWLIHHLALLPWQYCLILICPSSILLTVEQPKTKSTKPKSATRCPTRPCTVIIIKN